MLVDDVPLLSGPATSRIQNFQWMIAWHTSTRSTPHFQGDNPYAEVSREYGILSALYWTLFGPYSSSLTPLLCLDHLLLRPFLPNHHPTFLLLIILVVPSQGIFSFLIELSVSYPSPRMVSTCFSDCALWRQRCRNHAINSYIFSVLQSMCIH